MAQTTTRTDITRQFLAEHVHGDEQTTEGTLFTFFLGRAVRDELKDAFPDATEQERQDLAHAAAIGANTIVTGLVRGLPADLLDRKIPLAMLIEAVTSGQQDAMQAALDYAQDRLERAVEGRFEREVVFVG